MSFLLFSHRAGEAMPNCKPLLLSNLTPCAQASLFQHNLGYITSEGV